MTVESATYISDLVPGNTHDGSDAGEGDDHIALTKTVIQNTFPNVSGAVTSTHTELNALDITTLGTAQASKAITVSAGGAVNASSVTWSNLGTVTTADVNGGTIDGTPIGGSSAAAGAFTTLAASGAQTLTGATTLGTSLTLPAGATITELSIDGTLAGNSDAAVPTEKAVKTYVDTEIAALDFATESYVDARSRTVLQVEATVPATTNSVLTFFIPVPVSGTITRLDVVEKWASSGAALTISLYTAASALIGSVTSVGSTSGAIASDTTLSNDTVSAGTYLILQTSNPGGSAGDGKFYAAVTVAL